MPRVSNKRTYLDPIHQDIVLDWDKPAERLVIDLIDAVEFQRLRRIHQLGVSYFTFQGAEGSRFTHSVGVMHVASRLAEILISRQPEAESERAVILARPGSQIRAEHLAFIPRDQAGDVVLRFSREPTLEQIEHEYLRQVMTRHGGNRQKTAAVLGVSERQVYRLIEKYRAE